MKTPEIDFINWLDLFLIGKESLTPNDLEILKKKRNSFQISNVQIKDFTESEFKRPAPEDLIVLPTFNFKKGE